MSGTLSLCVEPHSCTLSSGPPLPLTSPGLILLLQVNIDPLNYFSRSSVAQWRVAQRHDKPAAVGWRPRLTAPGVSLRRRYKCQVSKGKGSATGGGRASIEGQILGLYLSRVSRVVSHQETVSGPHTSIKRAPRRRSCFHRHFIELLNTATNTQVSRWISLRFIVRYLPQAPIKNTTEDTQGINT